MLKNILKKIRSNYRLKVEDTKIFLTNGKECVVDADLLPELLKFRWSWNGRYVCRYERRGDKKLIAITLHRFVIGAKKGQMVDHINRNKLDNRISNLRFCNPVQSVFNRSMQKSNKSGFIGVCWHKKDKKWRVSIKVDRKNLFLGNFDNKIIAAKVYDKNCVKYHGEFAVLNFSNKK